MNPARHVNTRSQINLRPLSRTIAFYGRHLLILTGISMPPAVLRAFQTGAFGGAGKAAFFLEILVVLLRALLVMAIVGNGNPRRGWDRIKNAFGPQSGEKDYWSILVANFKRRWVNLLINMLAFAVLILAVNFLIYRIAEWPGLRSTPEAPGDSTPVVLFIKNLIVIPLTLVFQYILVLTLLGKTRENA